MSDSRALPGAASPGLRPNDAQWRALGERMSHVARASGCDIHRVPQIGTCDLTRPLEEAWAHAAGMAMRTVRLDPGWWRTDAGPMLAFLRERRDPVALIPCRGGYRMHGPQGTVRVDGRSASTLERLARQFCPTLPDAPARPVDLVRLALRGSHRELAAATALSAAAALLNTLIPVSVAVLVAHIIPHGDLRSLAMLGAALLAVTAASACCEFVSAGMLARIESRSALRLLCAVLHRCARLPMSFFREQGAGGLAHRLLALDDLQSTLTGAAIAGLIAGAFSVAYVIAMVWADPAAAAIGAVIIALAFIVSLGVAAIRARWGATELEAAGSAASEMLQALGGVEAIRSAAATERVIDRWLGQHRHARAAAMRGGGWRVRFDVASVAWPVIGTVIFWWVFAHGESSAAYMALVAAFAGALAGALDFGARLGEMAMVRPALERMAPILDSVPERSAGGIVPGELRGEIVVDSLAVRHPGAARDALADVCLQVAPGEFVAIVGPSGSGKSSLVAALLGLVEPVRGHVTIDGHRISDLDMSAVRRQFGTVIQQARLMPGSILDNIIGSTLCTETDAERAASAAGLAGDLARLPLGLRTFVSERTLSGGQVQKVMLARALLTSPRVLVLDEATSALDERVQADVMRHVTETGATRIVVAHRLSTVRNADRIYVLDAGRVVQEGTFEELRTQGGLFGQLLDASLA
jgi:ABC-type bacteriocin/lantibiotic exporter with double-glycine peptidase domain